MTWQTRLLILATATALAILVLTHQGGPVLQGVPA